MAASLTQDPLVGQTIDNRYKIIRLIARGGMAKVYQAEQIHLNRIVAIKVLDPKHVGADDPEFQKRFELEAQMTSKLNHPNTVTIHDYGFNPQKHFYYFVMEYIQGRTLRRAMKEENAFAVDRALHIAVQVARSVRQAHAVGVIHRDLKPSNILLTTHDNDDNYVKVVDFGLLKLKKESAFDGEKTEGVLMGSPRYMSPEQIKRLPVDHRSDIYSLGVNMYQMLTGKPPFSGSSAVQILMGHLNQPPPPFGKANPNIQVPKDVEKFVMQCLEKDPRKRPQSMDEVVETITAIQKESKKEAIYIAVPPAKTGKVDILGTAEIPVTIESSTEKDKGVEDAPSGPSAPPAWSDTITKSQYQEIQSEIAQPPVLPLDETGKKISKKFPTGLIVVFSIALISLIGIVTLAVFLIGPGKSKNKSKIETQTQGSLNTQTQIQKQTDKDTAGESKSIQPPIENAIRTFKISFSTDPGGANIFEGENLLCTTPCEIEWTVTPQDKDKTRKFWVMKENYEPVELTQKTPDSDVSIGIPLTPIPQSGKGTFEKKPKPQSEKPQVEKEKPQKDEGTKEEKKQEEKEKEKKGLKLIQDYPDS